MLYPEGMVELNAAAAEILRRCDGATPLHTVIADLETVSRESDLHDDVIEPVGAAV
jgi:pyrroloquinoline quinone biosynthesis protein D